MFVCEIDFFKNLTVDSQSETQLNRQDTLYRAPFFMRYLHKLYTDSAESTAKF